MTLTGVMIGGLLLIPGLVLFGGITLKICLLAVSAALMVDALVSLLTRSRRGTSAGQAAAMGLFVACTLPPTVRWVVPVVAAGAAVGAGRVLLGGLGNYLWHPVAVGRVLVQVLYHDELTPQRWPVLASGHLIWGSVSLHEPLPLLASWTTQQPPPGLDAWTTVRPVDELIRSLSVSPNGTSGAAITALIRDRLPAWWQTLLGVTGGALGEACAVAIIAAALLLVWAGMLRPRLAIGGLLGAALAAAILPVSLRVGDADIRLAWFPGFTWYEHLPVGLAWVAYHITAGELLLVLLVLAPDTSTTPLTRKGHLVFGTIIGGLTIALRVLIGLPAAGYWALLAANTCVPVIDRYTRRRVLGT
jgi:electron transport complex protein RnfD